MQPQNRLNPSENDALQDRVRELEMKSSNLEVLVVELLDKNERLRRELAKHEEKLHT